MTTKEWQRLADHFKRTPTSEHSRLVVKWHSGQLDDVPPCPRDGLDAFGAPVKSAADRLVAMGVPVIKWPTHLNKTVLFTLDYDDQLRLARAADDRRARFLRAESALQLASLLMPKRLVDEEIGDALECIQALLAEPVCSKWKIRLKIATTWFWMVVNAIKSLRSALSGKKAE